MRLLRRCLIALVAAVVACLIVPDYMSDRRFPFEMGAMKTMTIIHTAEAQYYSWYGRFAGSLQELASADLGLPPALARTNQAEGYKFTLSRTAHGYAIHATPTRYGTRARTFYSDESLSVYEHYGPEPATASDPLVK